MSKALIAYNNDSETVLHDFFQSCSDEAKQICTDYGVEFTSVCPPALTEQNVVGVMPRHQFCILAGHGDADGIYNENDEAVISTLTTNYNFNGKGFYSVACSCAQNLYPHLRTIGVQLFVGYREVLRVKGELEPFVACAMSGLRSLLAGDNVRIAKEKMLSTYDDQIAALDPDSWEVKFMVHNKEALVFEGEDSLLFTDLK